MSDDETAVTLVSAVVALVAWYAWFWRALSVARWSRAALPRTLVIVAPLLATGLLLGALRGWSAYDVREDPVYLTMYSLLGAAWVAMGIRMLPLLGISTRDDVLERENRAAAIVVAAAVLAITLCYIGGNIGDGPGWWVVVFSSGLATAALFVIWLAVEQFAGVSDAVTIDRDLASALRMAGLLVACGVVFARAAAGNWVSSEATVRDFAAIAAPALLLVAVAIVVERTLRPTPERAAPAALLYGAVPGLVYLNAAVFIVMRAGVPV